MSYWREIGLEPVFKNGFQREREWGIRVGRNPFLFYRICLKRRQLEKDAKWNSLTVKNVEK